MEPVSKLAPGQALLLDDFPLVIGSSDWNTLLARSNMFRSDKINVPVLGLIENMAWFTPEELPNNKYFIFGKEGCKQLAESMNVPLLGQIPIVQGICEGGDAGKPIALDENSITGKAFIAVAKQMIEEVNQRNAKLDPTKRVLISHK